MLDPTALADLGVRVDPRATVLKHGGLTPVPALPAGAPAHGSLLADGCVEVQALQGARRRFFDRLRALRAAGLAAHTTLALAQLRTGGDFTFLARTCGLPERAASQLDNDLEHEVTRLLGQGSLPDTAAAAACHQSPLSQRWWDGLPERSTHCPRSSRCLVA